MKTYRLPNGEEADFADYADAWQALGETIAAATGYLFMHYDPAIALKRPKEPNGQDFPVIELPPDFAGKLTIALLTADVDRKLLEQATEMIKIAAAHVGSVAVALENAADMDWEKVYEDSCGFTKTLAGTYRQLHDHLKGIPPQPKEEAAANG